MIARVCLGLAALALVGISPASGQTAAGSRPAPTEDIAAEAEARYEKQQQLVNALAKKRGYNLAEGELLKFIADPQNDERSELRRSFYGPEFAINKTGSEEGSFEPFMILFHVDEQGILHWDREHEGIATLAEVLELVLRLKRHEIECPPGLLMTYLPGDWVLSWNPQVPHEWSDAELTAFETILNEERNLGANVAWKTAERPALVVTGNYKATPKKAEFLNAEVAKQADGSFEIPARRSDISGSAGTYKELLQAIGEVLMMPVVDESSAKPTKNGFFWMYTGNPTSGEERLKPADEERVLKAISEQMGYDFKIEPREVKMLSIEPIQP